MIVFGLLARKRCGQKSPGIRKGKICQPRHALCWCVLWRIRKTAFHFSPGCVNGKLYRESLLPKLVEDRLSCGFIFQQDRAPAHTAKLAQNWIAANCSDFIGKDEWPPNSPELNLLGYHIWSYASTLQDISTQAKYHRRAEECLASCSPHGTICHRTLYQQGHTEHRQKTSELV